jgi:hypothetical protein
MPRTTPCAVTVFPGDPGSLTLARRIRPLDGVPAAELLLQDAPDPPPDPTPPGRISRTQAQCWRTREDGVEYRPRPFRPPAVRGTRPTGSRPTGVNPCVSRHEPCLDPFRPPGPEGPRAARAIQAVTAGWLYSRLTPAEDHRRCPTARAGGWPGGGGGNATNEIPWGPQGCLQDSCTVKSLSHSLPGPAARTCGRLPPPIQDLHSSSRLEHPSPGRPPGTGPRPPGNRPAAPREPARGSRLSDEVWPVVEDNRPGPSGRARPTGAPPWAPRVAKTPTSMPAACPTLYQGQSPTTVGYPLQSRTIHPRSPHERPVPPPTHGGGTERALWARERGKQKPLSSRGSSYHRSHS